MIDFPNLTTEQLKAKEKQTAELYKKTFHNNMTYLDSLFINCIPYCFQKKKMKITFNYTHYRTLDLMVNYLNSKLKSVMDYYTNNSKLNKLMSDYVSYSVIVNCLKEKNKENQLNVNYQNMLSLAQQKLHTLRTTPTWINWFEKD